MKWIQAKTIYQPKKNLLVDELISNVFSKFDIKSVIIEQSRLEPEEGWADDAISQPKEFSVTGYFKQDDTAKKKCRLLEKEVNNLSQIENLNCRVLFKTIEDQDWSEKWKEYFQIQKISDHIIIKPSFREYTPQKNEIIIEIDQGIAFGTGTHPTTSGCLKAIEKYLKPTDSFLDIGTGPRNFNDC